MKDPRKTEAAFMAHAIAIEAAGIVTEDVLWDMQDNDNRYVSLVPEPGPEDITITYYDLDKTDTEAIFVATWPIPDGTDYLNSPAVAASIAEDLAARVREADSK